MTSSRNRRRGSSSSRNISPALGTNRNHVPEESMKSETSKTQSSETKDLIESNKAKKVSHALDSSEPVAKPDEKSDKNGPAAGSQTEVKVASKRAAHYTRSKNSHRKREADPKYQEDWTDSPDSSLNCVSIDSCAAILASLDDRSYKRTLLRDANLILEDFIFPMSFPWAHNFTHHLGAAARGSMPRDIDDMQSILRVDDQEFPSIEKNGIYCRSSDSSCHPVTNALHKQLMDDNENFCAAIRRLDDPGTLDLATKMVRLTSLDGEHLPISRSHRKIPKASCLFKEPPLSQGTMFKSRVRNSFMDVDIETPGEISLQLFEQFQVNKRRRIESSLANCQSVMISVKVGSTSSRSSLFTDTEDNLKKPLLLPAILPSEVQSGRYMNVEDATSLNKKLGSFSCSHGGAASNVNGRSASRMLTGRTRLIWTEKTCTEVSQRVFYRSRLTKERMEAGMHKRPREVMVSIKVNGNLLMTSGGTPPGEASWIHVPKRNLKNPPNGLLVADAKIYEQSLDAAVATVTKNAKVKKFPFLEIDAFVDNVLHYPRLSKTKHDDWGSNIDCPIIDCLPSEDGLIHVTCTSPGVMKPTSVHDILNMAATNSGKVCSVCWSELDSHGKLPIECSQCGLVVHAKCSLNAWKCFEQKWLCPVCSYYKVSLANGELPQSLTHSGREIISSPRSGKKGRKGGRKISTSGGTRRSAGRMNTDDDSPRPDSPVLASKYLPCALCPHYGGAMSLMPVEGGGQSVWVHEVCRIWCDLTVLKKRPKLNTSGTVSVQPDVCILCGTTTQPLDVNTNAEGMGERFGTGLVKCAASACHVQVHPMCALLISKLEKERHEKSFGSKAEKYMTSKSDAASNDKFSIGSRKHPGSLSLKELKERDKYLCRQYTLACVTCTIPCAPDSLSHQGSKVVSTLPVFLCGIHNPKRDRSFFGFYPGGRYLDGGAMRIPPRKTGDR